jgi:hypothetical protein
MQSYASTVARVKHGFHPGYGTACEVPALRYANAGYGLLGRIASRPGDACERSFHLFYLR